MGRLYWRRTPRKAYMKPSLQLAILLLSIALLGGGVVALILKPSPGPVEIALPTSTPQPEIKVYVNGAVRSPGVYTAQEGDRLEDILAMAGGLTEDADPLRVNPSLRAEDEAHFYVPRTGEAVPTPPPSSTGVNINTASAEELSTLPGIGEEKANAIVEHRRQSGPFSREEDLLLVPGIGPKTLEDLLAFITVD